MQYVNADMKCRCSHQYFRSIILFLLAGYLSAAPASAQHGSSPTAAYPDSRCSSCAEWDAPQDPFRIHSNTYYVGPRGLSAILITSPEGHVLIDAALPSSVPAMMDNIRALGFEPADIKLILNSHAHFDHAGGIAAMQRSSGARVAASPRSASVLERGSSGPEDPQYGVLLDFPPVDNVERFSPGDTIRLGPIELFSHATAGHTPGGTTWSWRSCDQDGCVDLVYADSQTPVSADGFRFSDSETYPSAVQDFVQGHKVLESLSCDILITTHPGASSLWERLADGREGLIDSEACKKYAARSRKQLQERLQKEAEMDGSSSGPK